MFLSVLTAIFAAILLGETGGVNWSAVFLFIFA